MIDASDELARFLDEHGVGPWVRDELGKHMLVKDWAHEFVQRVLATCPEYCHDDAEMLRELRSHLSETDKKSISVAKLREMIE